MKNFTIALFCCFGMLFACNLGGSSDLVQDTIQAPENPNVSSSEPIHAVGGRVEVDPKELNHKIATHDAVLTVEGIMKLYYAPEVVIEGKEVITITQEELEEGKTKVTLIHDNMLDDAQKTTKIELTLEVIDAAWKVLKIEEQWKCYEGRGHSKWGIQPCT